MRVFSIFASLVYASVCFAQFNPVALENTLNSTFSEVVGYFEFIEQCQVIDGDTDTCVILSEEETVALEAQRAEQLVALNATRESEGLEPLEELPIPSFRYLKIDMGYTDFDSGKIKASIFAQTQKLASNENRETAEPEALVISADIITDLADAEEGKKLFSATANIEIQGNTLSILKSVADVYDSCSDDEENEETSEKPLVEGANSEIICILIKGIKKADSVTELETSIKKAVKVARDAFGEGEEANSTIEKVFSSLKIESVDGVLKLSFDLETSGADITADSVENLSGNVVISVAERGIMINASGTALLEAQQVEELTNRVKEVATDLADRDSEAHVTYFEDNLYLAFGVIEAFLVVEEDDEDDDFGDDDF